ncbi:MAG: hypothetical protein WCG67_07960, partial [Ferruginibacter sp.]
LISKGYLVKVSKNEGRLKEGSQETMETIGESLEKEFSYDAYIKMKSILEEAEKNGPKFIVTKINGMPLLVIPSTFLPVMFPLPVANF